MLLVGRALKVWVVGQAHISILSDRCNCRYYGLIIGTLGAVPNNPSISPGRATVCSQGWSEAEPLDLIIKQAEP